MRSSLNRMKLKGTNLFRYILLALVLWPGFFVYSQSTIDSLNLEMAKAETLEQEIRLHLLLAKEWIIKSPDSAAPEADQAFEKSQRIGDLKLEIEAQNLRANILQRLSESDAAMEIYAEAIRQAEGIDYQVGLAKLYNNVALIHTERGEFPEALEGFTKATRCEELTGNREGIAQGLNNIGVVFYYQGEYDKSLDYFLQSVEVHEAMGNRLSAKQGYNNIGAINEALGRHDEALKYYQSCLSIALELDDRAEVGQAYNNIAGAYSSLEDWKRAEEYFVKAIDLNSEMGDEYSLALNYLNLADLFAKSGQESRAPDLFLKASELVRKKGFKNLAFDLYDKMAIYYLGLEDYEKAYEYRQLYGVYKDSVYDEAKAKVIAETEALYETEKKDREAAEAKAELVTEKLKVQRQQLWFAVIIAVAILLISFSVFRIRQQSIRRKQIEAEAALKEERAQAEGRRKLEDERNRISRDLHDHIGAQLTIISSQIDQMAFKETKADVRERFEAISDHTRDTMAQLRETIWAMNNDEISLQMLQAKLQDFLHRSQQDGRELRILNNCQSSFKLGPIQTINLFRICQEAVQNALKYADFSVLEISFTCTEDRLRVRIQDDGKGIEDLDLNRGYGLSNMRARMKQIDGEFQMSSEPQKGTEINLSLQLNTSIAL